VKIQPLFLATPDTKGGFSEKNPLVTTRKMSCFSLLNVTYSDSYGRNLKANLR